MIAVPSTLVIVRTDRPGHNRRRACPEPDRHARDDHENWKPEAEGSKLRVTDLADEPGIDEALPHHRRDTEEHGHSHVDQVPADRSLR
jgi:hypothetical protein